LNEYLAQLPRRRCWFVIREDYTVLNTSCKGSVNGIDFPFIMVYQIFGQLPGAPDYRKGCMMYDNVTVLEEKIEGNTLTAKLKINDSSNGIVGRVRLVCLFVDHPPASIAEGMHANLVWEFAYSRAKPVYELLNQQHKLTPEQQRAIDAAMKATEAALDAQGGLPTELHEEKYWQAWDTAIAQYVVTLTPEQQKVIAEERKALDDLKRKANYYTGVWTSILVVPQQ